MSAKESLRVANASAKTSRKKASQRSAAVSSFDNLKVPELQRRAKKAGIKGRSTMNKKQLVRCPFTGAVHWRQLMAGSGGSQGFPAMARLMASSAVMPWAAAVSR